MALRNAVSIGALVALATTAALGTVPASRTSAAADVSAANPVMPPDAVSGTPVQLKTADGLTLGAHL